MTPSGQPGRDYTFNITIKDAAGDAQDLTTLLGYALIAYVEDNQVIGQWSKNEITGYDDIYPVDEATGQVKIFLSREKTASIANKMIYIEVVTESLDPENGAVQFGNVDGKKIELIKITSAGKAKAPALNP